MKIEIKSNPKCNPSV